MKVQGPPFGWKRKFYSHKSGSATAMSGSWRKCLFKGDAPESSGKFPVWHSPYLLHFNWPSRSPRWETQDLEAWNLELCAGYPFQELEGKPQKYEPHFSSKEQTLPEPQGNLSRASWSATEPPILTPFPGGAGDPSMRSKQLVAASNQSAPPAIAHAQPSSVGQRGPKACCKRTSRSKNAKQCPQLR